MSHPTTSVPPHRNRPSASALDRAFESHAHIEAVREVHALYLEAATGVLRVARRFETLGYVAHAATFEAVLTMVERLAAAHIEHLALAHALEAGQ